jgi:hypothetical protein
MKHCKTCKWWKARPRESRLGICERVDAYAQPGPVFDLFVTADDDSGLKAELETGGDFGCILHQEK